MAAWFIIASTYVQSPRLQPLADSLGTDELQVLESLIVETLGEGIWIFFGCESAEDTLGACCEGSCALCRGWWSCELTLITVVGGGGSLTSAP